MDIINANIFGNSLIKNQQNFISLEQSSYNYLIKLLKATNGVMFIEQYLQLSGVVLQIRRSLKYRKIHRSLFLITLQPLRSATLLKSNFSIAAFLHVFRNILEHLIYRKPPGYCFWTSNHLCWVPESIEINWNIGLSYVKQIWVDAKWQNEKL